MNEQKYKPIPFTAPMVRAILEGRKTQTRRLNGLDDVNKIPDAWDATRVTVGSLDYKVKKSAKGKYGATFISHPDAIANRTIHVCPQICPYGQPGDRLWVRETWQHSNFPFGPLDKSCAIFYRADYLNDPLGPDLELDTSSDIRRKWNPSTHMPRWASRITLEVTGVRVERLQDISGEDCWAEGIECAGWDSEKYGSVTHCYRDLWESINGPGSWKTNPWVWVIEFKRVKEK